MEEIICI